MLLDIYDPEVLEELARLEGYNKQGNKGLTPCLHATTIFSITQNSYD